MGLDGLDLDELQHLAASGLDLGALEHLAAPAPATVCLATLERLAAEALEHLASDWPVRAP